MICFADKSHSKQIAEIHKKTISKGFLVKLGVDFLTLMYQFLIMKEVVIISIEEGKINGFVSFSKSSEGMMKKFIFDKPKAILLILKTIIAKPSYIKPILETAKATSHTVNKNNMDDLPKAELLSISVLDNTQQKGVGSQLIKALEDTLKQLNIEKYKVTAGEQLEKANLFYQKNGFQLTCQIIIHNNEISNVYVKNLSIPERDNNR